MNIGDKPGNGQSTARLVTHGGMQGAGQRGHWGQPQVLGTSLGMGMEEGMDGDGKGWDVDLWVGSAQQSRAGGTCRPALLQQRWGRDCPALCISPLVMCSWIMLSWDKELQRTELVFFHIYPKNSAENTSLMKNK